MIAGALSRLVRYGNPVSISDMPIGTLTSPLEAYGERIGTTIVESVFARPDIQSIRSAFGRYLGNPERADLALKKAFHIAFEARVRNFACVIDPPENHGMGLSPRILDGNVLDPIVAKALNVDSPFKPRSIWTVVLSIHVQACALVASVLSTAIGAPSAGKTKRYCMGTPAFGDAEYWKPIIRASAEHQSTPSNTFAAVVESGYDIHPGKDLDLIPNRNRAIDRSAWWKQTVIPACRLLRLAFSTLVSKRRNAECATVTWFAFHLARKGLEFERLLHATKFDIYLDITEYSADHIVKAALLERHGGRLMRWPHCIMDNPGAALSYLGYHIFLGTGSYEFDTYGSTWASDCAHRAVGFFKNDHRWTVGGASDAMIAAIETQKKSGRRILGYFGPSGTSLLDPVVDGTLRAIMARLSTRPDWCLVVKAKGRGAMRHIKASLDKIETAAAVAAEGRLIVVPYEYGGGEPCPAGWLIHEMTFGVGLGSVQLEGLTQGKPIFSYLPVVPDSPFQKCLSDCGLAYDSAEALGSAIGRYMDNPNNFQIRYDWFRSQFDPFSDQYALDRIVPLIQGAKSSSTNICARKL